MLIDRSLCFILFFVAWSSVSYGSACSSLLNDQSQIKTQASSLIQELNTHISNQIYKTDEFKQIKELAEKEGLRVWMFGGTASSFIHYVKWDLLRQKGLMKLQADRFDYDFTNIFRSTQDLDIVIDGDPDKAYSFQRTLAKKFPHFLGAKDNQWEVRTLNHSMGTPGKPGFKEALLNDKDFNSQNTDSNSIGMVEITTKNNEQRVRDIKSWDSESIFLADVIHNEISFFRNPQHFESSRAKLGQNPEILSVIRILVKTFQYDLNLTDQSLKEVQKIISEFEPEKIENKVALRKIEETSRKLIMHAVNIEYALDFLEKTGLKSKIISMGDVTQYSSAAWWLNKEALKSKKIADLGDGKTAQQLGIEIVAHETNSFLAYESITRSHSGKPNVLISRDGYSGEMAAYGNGFYTQIGKYGAAGTNLTIRFKVHPDAREGKDFIQEDNYIIFHNKNALRVIPESLNISLVDLVSIAKGEQAFEVDQSDLALIEKLKRRMNESVIIQELESLLNSSSEENLRELVDILNVFKSKIGTRLLDKKVIQNVSVKILEKITPLRNSENEKENFKYTLIVNEIIDNLKNQSEFLKDYKSYLLNFIRDKKRSFALRKKALFYFPYLYSDIEGYNFYSKSLRSFSKREKEDIKETLSTWVYLKAADPRKKAFENILLNHYYEFIKILAGKKSSLSDRELAKAVVSRNVKLTDFGPEALSVQKILNLNVEDMEDFDAILNRVLEIRSGDFKIDYSFQETLAKALSQNKNVKKIDFAEIITFSLSKIETDDVRVTAEAIVKKLVGDSSSRDTEILKKIKGYNFSNTELEKAFYDVLFSFSSINEENNPFMYFYRNFLDEVGIELVRRSLGLKHKEVSDEISKKALFHLLAIQEGKKMELIIKLIFIYYPEVVHTSEFKDIIQDKIINYGEGYGAERSYLTQIVQIFDNYDFIDRMVQPQFGSLGGESNSEKFRAAIGKSINMMRMRRDEEGFESLWKNEVLDLEAVKTKKDELLERLRSTFYFDWPPVTAAFVLSHLEETRDEAFEIARKIFTGHHHSWNKAHAGITLAFHRQITEPEWEKEIFRWYWLVSASGGRGARDDNSHDSTSVILGDPLFHSENFVELIKSRPVMSEPAPE